MKKVIYSFILVFMLVLFGLNNVKAEENNVEIKSIEIQEKSDNVSSNIEEDNELNYNMDLELYDIDDYITYKIIVKNNSNKDYEIDTIKDNLESQYLESLYTTNKNELKKGEEVEIYLTLKYKQSITTSKEIFNHNLVITLKYTNGEVSTISDIVLDDNTVSAGNTGINKNIIIKIICYSVIVVSIILLIVLAVLRKKKLKSIGLLLLLFMIPTVFAEDNEGKCTINISIILHSTNTVTFKTGKEVNLIMNKLSGAPDDLKWEYDEYYDDYYLYSESVDWYENYNIISIEKAMEEQYNNVKDNLTSENIVSTDDSKYPIYMWYETTGEYWQKWIDRDNYVLVEKGKDGDDGNHEYFEGGIIYWYTDASLVYINKDASCMFIDLYAIQKLDLSEFNTRNVTNMSKMFSGAGANSTSFELDISDWDTSNVEDMSIMFCGAGANSTSFELDISGWDTSNVINMRNMFSGAGSSSTSFELDLSNWDVSNVTDMIGIFSATGSNSTSFKLDLSNWDVSNVTDMSEMFDRAGMNATEWNIGDLSNWDISNVTNMYGMFCQAGMNATEFYIEGLSDWDTSNVTNMYGMFMSSGANATTFSLDLSNWDVSKVTDMSWMFSAAGMNATEWNIGNLSTWDTSNVMQMQDMFYRAGRNATEWNIGSLNIYAHFLDYMFGECSNANAVLNFYSIPSYYYYSSSAAPYFHHAAVNSNSKIILNYTAQTQSFVENVVDYYAAATHSNVVKGTLIE